MQISGIIAIWSVEEAPPQKHFVFNTTRQNQFQIQKFQANCRRSFSIRDGYDVNISDDERRSGL